MAKLTEKDILAWDGPEEDYMNAQHLEFFRTCSASSKTKSSTKPMPPPTACNTTPHPLPTPPTAPAKKKNTP